MKFQKLFLITPIILFLTLKHSENILAEENNNSIIKYFCLKTVKSEFKMNNVAYSKDLGEDICNCYLKNIAGNFSHEESITNCKLENKKKINL